MNSKVKAGTTMYDDDRIDLWGVDEVMRRNLGGTEEMLRTSLGGIEETLRAINNNLARLTLTQIALLDEVRSLGASGDESASATTNVYDAFLKRCTFEEDDGWPTMYEE